MAPGNLVYQIILVLVLCSDGAVGWPWPWPCREDVTIKTPTPMEALSGSCLNIPCTYTDIRINTRKPFTGIWSNNTPAYDQNAANVISVSGSKSYPMDITGNLMNKDCTTTFHDLTKDHEDKYYFRIENGPNKATAVCSYLEIRVRDSPWSPSIKVSGEQTEAEVFMITCSAVTPCAHAPPQLTWDLHQGTSHITETNPDGTIITKTKLSITLTDSHDGLMIKCSAVYPVSLGAEKMSDSNIILSVTYGPKDTSVQVSPSGTLSTGQSVTLSCSSRAKPPVQKFIWFRRSSQGPVSVSEGDTYNFSICDGGDYYCVASNPLSNASSQNVLLRITDAPGSPSIEVSGEQTETEVVTLTCSAVTPCPHAPPQLTWDLHQGTSGITETNFTEKNPDGTIITKTKLNITLTDSHDGKVIKCSAAYPVSGGVKATEENVTLNVTYGPKDTSVRVSPSGTLSTGQSVTLSCSSRAKPPVQNFTWFRNSSVSVSEGDTYNFNFTEDVDFYCMATNALGTETSPVIHLSVTALVGNNHVPWEAILGAVIGVLAVVFLAVSVWCFITKSQIRKDKPQAEVVQREENIHYEEIDLSKLKPKEASNHEVKELKEDTVYSLVQLSQAKPAEDTIHYGEVDFSKFTPKVVPEKELEETVYSQVQGSNSANNGGQFSDGVDDLYAKVKKN